MRKKSMLSLLLALALLSSCAGRKAAIPPVSPAPTETYHHGKFVWFDLLTNDIPAAKKFYGELLGWQFESLQPSDTAFTVIKHNGRAIGSMVYVKRLNPEVSESRWLGSLSVPEVDKAVDYVRNNGGKVYREAKNYPDRGRLAVVGDPQGAVVALLKASGGDPADQKPETGEWLWNELFAEDIDKAVLFYQSLAGYEHETQEVFSGVNYNLLKRDGIPRAGIIKIPWEGIKPNWLPYIRVDDPAPLAARVESLGGKLLLPPDKSIRNASVAVIADPTGAAVALQKWPVEEEERSESQ